MKPYYVLALFGAQDQNGTSAKFGLVGVDDPVEAEKLAIGIAGQHKNEQCALAVLQLYGTYSETLLYGLTEAQKKLAALEAENAVLKRKNDSAEYALKAAQEAATKRWQDRLAKEDEQEKRRRKARKAKRLKTKHALPKKR